MPDPEVSDNTAVEDPERRKALLSGIALPNPFAQINGLPPVTPLTVTNPSMAAARYSAPPVAAPSTSPSAPVPQPAMGGLPPVQTSPEDQRVQTAQQKLAELQAKPSIEQRTTDWGARHGTVGKIGAGLLRGVEPVTHICLRERYRSKKNALTPFKG